MKMLCFCFILYLQIPVTLCKVDFSTRMNVKTVDTKTLDQMPMNVRINVREKRWLFFSQLIRLIVRTFGRSLITQGTRTITTGVQQLVRTGVRQVIRTGVQQGFKTAIKEGAKQIGKQTLKEMAKKGLKETAKEVVKELAEDMVENILDPVIDGGVNDVESKEDVEDSSGNEAEDESESDETDESESESDESDEDASDSEFSDEDDVSDSEYSDEDDASDSEYSDKDKDYSNSTNFDEYKNQNNTVAVNETFLETISAVNNHVSESEISDEDDSESESEDSDSDEDDDEPESNEVYEEGYGNNSISVIHGRAHGNDEFNIKRYMKKVGEQNEGDTLSKAKNNTVIEEGASIDIFSEVVSEAVDETACGKEHTPKNINTCLNDNLQAAEELKEHIAEFSPEIASAFKINPNGYHCDYNLCKEIGADSTTSLGLCALQYCVCSNGIAILKECPLGQIFDIINGCTPSNEVEMCN